MRRDPQREDTVLEALAAGEGMAALGRRLGLSRERVRQIAKQAARPGRRREAPSELQAQAEVCRYLEAVGALFCHVPNGGARTAGGGRNLQRAGVKPGVPDLLVFGLPGRKLRPVAIEMKAGAGKLKAAQVRWANLLLQVGWDVVCTYSAGDAVDVLRGAGYR